MTNKEPLEIHKRPTTKPANNQPPTTGDQQLANEAPLEIQPTPVVAQPKAPPVFWKGQSPTKEEW